MPSRARPRHLALAPISAGRGESWDNVIRHIVAEAMIQRAFVGLDPSRFEQRQMLHKISPAGRPVSPRNGTAEAFTFVLDGSPRCLAITGATGVEIYDEGPAPPPSSGLAAIAKTFPSGGDVGLASAAPAASWRDPGGGNNWALRDVPGFELCGGTESTAQVDSGLFPARF